MVDYNGIIERVKVSLANDADVDLTAKDIDNLSPQQIEGVQKVINDYSIDYIAQAYEKGLIPKDAADYLSGIYSDAMETYRSLYKNISNTLLEEYRPQRLKKLEELGEEPAPEEINSINLDTGEIELNSAYVGRHDNSSRYMEYRPKHITPFTNMRLTFYDLRDNPIYVIMPGLKNIRRAVEKIRGPILDPETGKVIEPGGKYYQQYIKDVKELKNKVKDPQEYNHLFAQISKPYQRLKDVVRFTITRKYYMDTEETLGLFSKDSKYGVDVAETKDSFNANSNNSKQYNEKNYRDKKLYLHMQVGENQFVVETQIKITKLYEGDIDTHKIYAGEPDAQSENNNFLITTQNTTHKGLRYWEEGLKRFNNFSDRKLANMHIFRLKMAIQKRNKEAIRAYNLQVIDKAFRLEDAKLANGKNYDASCINSRTGKSEEIFEGVADFISKNFIYRPFKAYDKSNAFNVFDEELRTLGLVISTEQMLDFTERYSKYIVPKYNGIIEGSEALYFTDNKASARLDVLFAKDAYNEQPQTDELSGYQQEYARLQKRIKEKEEYNRNAKLKNLTPKSLREDLARENYLRKQIEIVTEMAPFFKEEQTAEDEVMQEFNKKSWAKGENDSILLDIPVEKQNKNKSQKNKRLDNKNRNKHNDNHKDTKLDSFLLIGQSRKVAR